MSSVIFVLLRTSNEHGIVTAILTFVRNATIQTKIIKKTNEQNLNDFRISISFYLENTLFRKKIILLKKNILKTLFNEI